MRKIFDSRMHECSPPRTTSPLCPAPKDITFQTRGAGLTVPKYRVMRLDRGRDTVPEQPTTGRSLPVTYRQITKITRWALGLVMAHSMSCVPLNFRRVERYQSIYA